MAAPVSHEIQTMECRQKLLFHCEVSDMNNFLFFAFTIFFSLLCEMFFDGSHNQPKLRRLVKCCRLL